MLKKNRWNPLTVLPHITHKSNRQLTTLHKHCNSFSASHSTLIPSLSCREAPILSPWITLTQGFIFPDCYSFGKAALVFTAGWGWPLIQPGLRSELRVENQQRELRFCKMRHHPGSSLTSWSKEVVSSVYHSPPETYQVSSKWSAQWLWDEPQDEVFSWLLIQDRIHMHYCSNTF